MSKIIKPSLQNEPLSEWSTHQIEKSISTLEAGQALWPDETPLGKVDILYHKLIDEYKKELEKRK